jgi:hypothetical protein
MSRERVFMESFQERRDFILLDNSKRSFRILSIFLEQSLVLDKEMYSLSFEFLSFFFSSFLRKGPIREVAF